MTALQCDAAAIYDKRKDNLRFFLDNLPSHPCHVQPNFNLCTVCFKINHDIAKGCMVFQRFNQGIVESKMSDPLHVELARSIDFRGAPSIESEVPEELEKEFPLFEFAAPAVQKVNFDEEEPVEAEVLEAEVVEEEPTPPPVVKKVVKVAPGPTATPAQTPTKIVKVKKAVKPVPKQTLTPTPVAEVKPPAAPIPAPPAPAKPEEKKAPDTPAAAVPAKPLAPANPPIVKTIRKVKKEVKVGPQPPITGARPMPIGPPKPMATGGIKDVTKAGPGESPAPGPIPLEPRPDITPPPPGPGPSPSPEPDDDYDDEDMAILKGLDSDLDKKAPSRPPGPPPLRIDAKPTTPPGPPKAMPQKPGQIAPLFAKLGKLETKKKPDE